jgi:hypothetical protein
MARIRMTTRLTTPTSSKALQKEGEASDTEVMHGSTNGAPKLQTKVKAKVDVGGLLPPKVLKNVTDHMFLV